MKTVHIGLIGFGTVGAGVAETILKNCQLLAKRAGFNLNLKKIADLDITTDRGVQVPSQLLTTDAWSVTDDPEIQIVIELVGGTTFAKEVILRALRNGKSVVTANKALLAEHGEELFATAAAHGVDISFEASVGGGIPCIKALREGLVANRIKQILGILNGTCNYILTRMETERANFHDVLAAAQAAGYAEANPALDVDGHDTAHKAAILASLAFGRWFKAEDVCVQGIGSVTIDDIEYAASLGYRIKLLAIIKEIKGRIQLGVHPALVPSKSLLANVNGVFNAVWVQGDIVGNTMYYGRGAGRAATASAVLADVVDLGLNLTSGCPRRLPPFASFQHYEGLLTSTEITSRFYVRLQIADRPGVLATVSGVLGKHGISLASVTQREVDQTSVPMIMITHEANEADIKAALTEINQLPEVSEKPVLFRMEEVE